MQNRPDNQHLSYRAVMHSYRPLYRPGSRPFQEFVVPLASMFNNPQYVASAWRDISINP